MTKLTIFSFLLTLLLLNISGCVPLMIGGAVGALGGYAVSKDTSRVRLIGLMRVFGMLPTL